MAPQSSKLNISLAEINYFNSLLLQKNTERLSGSLFNFKTLEMISQIYFQILSLCYDHHRIQK